MYGEQTLDVCVTLYSCTSNGTLTQRGQGTGQLAAWTGITNKQVSVSVASEVDIPDDGGSAVRVEAGSLGSYDQFSQTWYSPVEDGHVISAGTHTFVIKCENQYGIGGRIYYGNAQSYGPDGIFKEATSTYTPQSATFVDYTHTDITFDNAPNETAAETTSNWSCDHSVTISAAVVQSNTKVVRLTHSTLTGGTTYTFTADNDITGAGDKSVQLTAPLEPPTGVSISFDGTDIDVTWNDNATNETGYKYKVAYDGGSYGSVVTISNSQNAESVSFTPTAGWSSVKVAVAAYNATLESSWAESGLLYRRVAGTGNVGFSGSGAISVAAAPQYVAGTGNLGLTGSGALSATNQLSGNGSIEFGGSGVIDDVQAVAGGGAVSLSGSGAIHASNIVAGGGAIGVSGDGAYSNKNPIAGEAQVGFTGSGALGSRQYVSGTGNIGLEGEGTFAADNPIAGTGNITVTGEGTARTAIPLAGGGSIAFIGSGEISASEPGKVYVAGDGNIGISGSGKVLSVNPLAGDGALTFSGGGALHANAKIAGEGDISFTGDGVIEIVDYGVRGDGDVGFTGSGLVLSANPIAGDGTLVVSGSGRIILYGAERFHRQLQGKMASAVSSERGKMASRVPSEDGEVSCRN
jgi:hypothetical protein